MKRSDKPNGKLDVHVNFTPPLSNILRREAVKEQRTFAQLIRFVLTQHYGVELK